MFATKLSLFKIERNQTIFVMIFYTILSVGCFWQIFNVCSLYLEYKTNVFIDTNFDSVVSPLPAITFCGELKQFNDGLNSSYALDKASKEFKLEIIKNIAIIRPIGRQNVRNWLLSRSLERISYDRYCITINTNLSGLKNFYPVPLKFNLNYNFSSSKRDISESGRCDRV